MGFNSGFKGLNDQYSMEHWEGFGVWANGPPVYLYATDFYKYRWLIILLSHVSTS